MISVHQISPRKWEVRVNGEKVFTTHRGLKGALEQGAFQRTFHNIPGEIMVHYRNGETARGRDVGDSSI